MPGALTAFFAVIDEALLDRLVVVSPHFDDAVLGCGRLLAAHPGSTVVTVMGGQRVSGTYDVVSWWDELSGFKPGDDVVAARRAEDKAALDLLGAHQRWLDFPDHQYDLPAPGQARPPAEAVADALGVILDELAPTAVVVPMGLANPDHVLAHDACRIVIDRRPEAWTWLAYAEAGYEHIPGMLAWRVGRLLRGGLWPTPAPIITDSGAEAKRASLECYVSQIPPLAADWGYDLDTSPRIAESYWRLAPPPPGWERLQDA